MKEQIDYLSSISFTVTYIGIESDENGILEGNYKFIFSSPESILCISNLRDMLTPHAYKNLELLVVDEAVIYWNDLSAL
ncbi:hypothetical protein ACJMK2_025230, partial [Sinanodonta woodiana]